MILSRHVDNFIAVAQYRSLAVAAEHLFISSAALSQQMKLLEQDVGVPLLTRSYKGIVLTPSGEVFLEKMKQLKSIEQESIQLALRAAELSLPSLSIAYTHNIQNEELQKIERRLKEEYHQDVQMYAVPFEHAVQNTINKVFDACIVPTGERLNKSNLTTIPYRIERPYLSVPYNHPLAQNKWISRQELNDIEIVLPERGLFQNIDFFYEELQKYSIQARITVITDVLQSEMYCRKNCALRLSRSKALSTDMIVIPFETEAINKICFAYPSDDSSEKKLKYIISLIREEAILE